jgi:hypothetical protein
MALLYPDGLAPSPTFPSAWTCLPHDGRQRVHVTGDLVGEHFAVSKRTS